MAFESLRDEDEIDQVVSDAYEIGDTVGTKWHGMTYEQGVVAALDWIKGDAENPLEEN